MHAQRQYYRGDTGWYALGGDRRVRYRVVYRDPDLRHDGRGPRASWQRVRRELRELLERTEGYPDWCAQEMRKYGFCCEQCAREFVDARCRSRHRGGYILRLELEGRSPKYVAPDVTCMTPDPPPEEETDGT